MRNLYIILIVSILLGCNDSDDKKIDINRHELGKNYSGGKILNSNKVLLVKELEDALKEYIEKEPRTIIAMVFAYRDNCKPTIILYELQELIKKERLPNSYAIVDNVPVLIYFGFENLFQTPSVETELSSMKVPFVFEHYLTDGSGYEPSYIFLDESKNKVVYDTIINCTSLNNNIFSE